MQARIFLKDSSTNTYKEGPTVKNDSMEGRAGTQNIPGEDCNGIVWTCSMWLSDHYGESSPMSVFPDQIKRTAKVGVEQTGSVV